MWVQLSNELYKLNVILQVFEVMDKLGTEDYCEESDGPSKDFVQEGINVPLDLPSEPDMGGMYTVVVKARIS